MPKRRLRSVCAYYYLTGRARECKREGGWRKRELSLDLLIFSHIRAPFSVALQPKSEAACDRSRVRQQYRLATHLPRAIKVSGPCCSSFFFLIFQDLEIYCSPVERVLLQLAQAA
ncbi:hypothetical protein GJAV_G00090770 [Gymnothorax javanicus]|nr:hypothetical protein GJAV_G00090770 [Gymnothorax javanicus]